MPIIPILLIIVIFGLLFLLTLLKSISSRPSKNSLIDSVRDASHKLYPLSSEAKNIVQNSILPASFMRSDVSIQKQNFNLSAKSIRNTLEATKTRLQWYNKFSTKNFFNQINGAIDSVEYYISGLENILSDAEKLSPITKEIISIDEVLNSMDVISYTYAGDNKPDISNQIHLADNSLAKLKTQISQTSTASQLNRHFILAAQNIYENTEAYLSTLRIYAASRKAPSQIKQPRISQFISYDTISSILNQEISRLEGLTKLSFDALSDLKINTPYGD